MTNRKFGLFHYCQNRLEQLMIQFGMVSRVLKKCRYIFIEKTEMDDL